MLELLPLGQPGERGGTPEARDGVDRIADPRGGAQGGRPGGRRARGGPGRLRGGRHAAARRRTTPRDRARRGGVRARSRRGTTSSIATGPLTSPALEKSLLAALGEKYLYFYDAMAPIVEFASLDMEKLYALSRWGKGGGDDYLNVPLSKAEYESFVKELLAGEKVPFHDFEKAVYFEGCLPIEAMAERGIETLRHGPMKPFGLPGPPHREGAVRRRAAPAGRPRARALQPRGVPDEAQGRRAEARLPDAAGAREGGVRPLRDAPPQYVHQRARASRRAVSLEEEPARLLRGPAHGRRGLPRVGGHRASWWARRSRSSSRAASREALPFSTALGSLAKHVSFPREQEYTPMNVTFGLIEEEDVPGAPKIRDRAKRRAEIGRRALAAVARWREEALPGPALQPRERTPVESRRYTEDSRVKKKALAPSPVLSAALLVAPAPALRAADERSENWQTHCSVCHGDNGKGADGRRQEEEGPGSHEREVAGHDRRRADREVDHEGPRRDAGLRQEAHRARDQGARRRSPEPREEMTVQRTIVKRPS